MDERRARIEHGVDALYRRAVRVPLPDAEAERAHYENMMRVADGRERQAALLADPDVPLSVALDYLVEEMRNGFEHRLCRLVGDGYDDVADAYVEGERDDWVGELAVYYRECLLRIEEHTALDDQVCVLVLLRYPDSFTANFCFLEGGLPDGGVRFESPMHAGVDYDDDYGERYYAESRYAQREAAAYVREGGAVVREQFPDPDETPREDRAYGGFVYMTGRRDDVFADLLEPLTPDPGRFDAPPTSPGIVPEGPEARRVRDEYLTDADVVA
ncbi:hypothetical protein J2752_002057 [Halarchaeum rubridurum]|uniref:Uncharacterized protein n=1 Tax=Halarchaeum rubridurum TaxID=489911 RepID=A0A830FZZ2_9EURY|nr:hypothetical protein [Halarchaeum rubridurum]MBP1955145.1 hypothetical protein [Halarchaeum rubridurum]GGM68572.1 hypothetical protein GCM10009017_18500 [Halarchaeum rubridurum]